MVTGEFGKGYFVGSGRHLVEAINAKIHELEKCIMQCFFSILRG